MITYASYAQFTAVYSLQGISQTNIESYWLGYGALRVNEELASCFTIPFSSTNHTARDLSIRFAFEGIQNRKQGNPIDLRVDTELTNRLDDIKNANKPMIYDDGSTIFATNYSNTTYSTTDDYYNVFNMLDVIDQHVDPDLIRDELNQ